MCPNVMVVCQVHVFNNVVGNVKGDPFIGPGVYFCFVGIATLLIVIFGLKTYSIDQELG
jgi:hypothetical protein